MDTLTKEERSKRMGRVKSTGSKPEMIVRRLVHRLGYRYRLHRRDLPGKPDLVFSPKEKIIFVHGCFWHRHNDKSCKLARLPKSRHEFWIPKLEGNKQRDACVQSQLRKMGWDILVVWECETKYVEELTERILRFLDG